MEQQEILEPKDHQVTQDQQEILDHQLVEAPKDPIQKLAS